MQEIDQSKMRRWVESRLNLLKWLNLMDGKITSTGRGLVRKRAYDCIVNRRAMLENMLISIVLLPVCRIKGCGVCCFFNPGKGIGVPVDKKVIPRLRAFSDEAGVKNPIKAVDVDSMGDYLKEKMQKHSDEFIYNDGGREFVYHTTLGGMHRLPPEILENLPSITEKKVMWARSDSMPCAFLNSQRSCILYKSGICPQVCRKFICMTGNAINFISYMGGSGYEFLTAKPLSMLNEMAENIDESFSTRLAELEGESETRFKTIVEQYAAGGKITPESLDTLESLEAEVRAERARNIDALIEKVKGQRR